jgi:hypothetical protein
MSLDHALGDGTYFTKLVKPLSCDDTMSKDWDEPGVNGLLDRDLDADLGTSIPAIGESTVLSACVLMWGSNFLTFQSCQVRQFA